MKRILTVVLMTVLLCGLCMGIFSSAADKVTDPAQVYEVQKAPYEDEGIKLWFEHSFKKVMTSDTTPSGMDSYTVYMGKNEIENAQFVLYSDETKARHRATISAFTDENGNTVDAELYYQMYINLFDLNTLAYPGATEENTFIRNGEQPDPMVPLSKINLFQLNGGKSQAFYIRLKTTEASKPGWYSAQLDIKNAKGQIVKTATVYAYVWDFTISEKTEYETSFFLNNAYDTYGSYKEYYDYLLENRILAMDVPGELNSSNPYLTNDRVNAIRVSAANGGNTGAYLDHYAAYPEYAAIYADLSSMKEWEQIKNKFYFYTLDEAMSQEFIDSHGWGTGTINDVNFRSEHLDKYWPDARKVIPYHENHAFPYYTYDKPIAQLAPGSAIDGLQSMIDEDSCTLWCPQFYGFTPNAEIISHGYDQFSDDAMIRTLSGTRSGNLRLGEGYFNWESVFGDLRDRILSDVIIENRDDKGYDAVWTYSAGYNSGYAYPNHLIENTGLQTKMLLWQSYQLDITGYLYYGANFWNEYDDRNGDYVDYTVTGNLTGRWKVNLHPTYADGHPVFGNGMLFYKTTHSPLTNVDYIGSVRVELLRDGIEEYQMFTMLEDLRGSKAAKDIVNTVSENVISYVSMPEFDRSAFDDSMDEYDIMAATRIRLGNELEAASRNACQHKYDDGKVTVEPKCLVMGEIEYTCTLCGAKQIESLPTLHSEEENWNVTVVTAATCTTAGELRYDCDICGYSRTEAVEAHHMNEEMWVYEPHSVMTAVHSVICSKCNTEMRRENHIFRAQYTNTCTEAGVHYDTCIYCGYQSKIEDVPAKGHNLVESYKAPTCTEAGHKGAECYNCDYSEAEILEVIDHNYVDGKCTMCGESDGSVSATPGDVDGDGEVTMLDLFALKLFIKQKDVPTDAEVAAGDIDGDGELTMVDSFELKYRISKGFWRE